MFAWTTIYSGMIYEEFIRIENILTSNQIKMKTKVKSNRNRLANNVVMGANPAVLNAGGMNQEYKIQVKKDDFERACFLIQNKKY